MAVNVPTMQDLLSAGAHFGHQVRRGHPKMGQYIYEARDGVHIIDLAQTESKLKEATEFAYQLGKLGKVLLVVGTKKQARGIVEELAIGVNTPYLTAHWVGGLLTNFDEIKRNLKKLTDLKTEKESGALSRYTKKERLLIDKRLQKFEKELGGLKDLNQVPDALFVVDCIADKTAVVEAIKKGIILVGFADTNANPSQLDYPIPANDDGIKSIKLICETVIKAYGQGKKDANLAAEKEKKLQEEEAIKDLAEKANPKKQKDLDKEPIIEDEEVAVLEEQIEEKVLEESERKV